MENELSEVLERLYRQRFSDADLFVLKKVWNRIVKGFFQKRIDKNATVLDLGAGACLFINEVQAKRRIAVDANPDTTKYVSADVELISSSDLTLNFIQDGSIDVIFMSNFLEHLSNYLVVLQLFRTCWRKLKPGGNIMILQPNYRLEPKGYFDFLDHTIILTDRSLVEGLKASGFHITELIPRFLPFTSKSKLPKSAWLVSIYLRVKPLQWFFGKQTFIQASRSKESD